MCRKLPARAVFFGSFFCLYKKRDSPKGEEERFEVAREELRWGDKTPPEGRRRKVGGGKGEASPGATNTTFHP
jgi:hypothetical protein